MCGSVAEIEYRAKDPEREYLQVYIGDSGGNRRHRCRCEPMFDGHIGFTDAVSHKIETGNHPPIRQSPRRLPPHLRDEVRAQLDELVSQ